VGRARLGSMLAAIGVMALVSGAALIGTSTMAAAATPTLSATVTSSSSGATCGTTPVSGSLPPFSTLCSDLSGGDVISLKGAGFHASALGSSEECNADPTQPNILFLGNYIPVSCTPVAIVSTTSTGTFSGSFTIKSGTTGPPATSSAPVCTNGSGSPVTTTTVPGCTTSGSGATDAAKYPCPPTAAQQAAGITCVIAIGDISGDRAVGAILFKGESTGGTTTTSGATSTSGASTSTTGATTWIRRRSRKSTWSAGSCA